MTERRGVFGSPLGLADVLPDFARSSRHLLFIIHDHTYTTYANEKRC